MHSLVPSHALAPSRSPALVKLMQNNSEILEPPQLAEFALRLAPGELGRVEYIPVKLTRIAGIRMNDV